MCINKQTKLELLFPKFKESNSYFLYLKKILHTILRFIIKRQHIYHKYILTLYLPTSQNKLYCTKSS